MNKKTKLKRILNALSPEEDFKDFDAEVENLKQNLKETINLKTVADVKKELQIFKGKINLEPLLKGVEELKILSSQREQNTLSLIKEELGKVSDGVTPEELTKLRIELLSEQGSLESKSTEGLIGLGKNLDTFKSDVYEKLRQSGKEFSQALPTFATLKDLEGNSKTFSTGIEALRKDVFSRLANLGGGSMNRQIKVGGTDVLTKYTDINFVAGTGVSISASTDNTNKRVNITLTAPENGDVAGPASSTDNAIALWDSTTGKLLKNSTLTYASNILNIENSTSGQIISVGASGLKGEFGVNSAGTVQIKTKANRSLQIFLNDTQRWEFLGAGTLIASTDNSYDIGLSGASRPRSIYLGTTLHAQYGNGSSILFGADGGASTLTNSTTKIGRVGTPHYLNAEEPMGIFLTQSDATNNTVYIGGGTGVFNAATIIRFFTAADNVTTSGTERWTINSPGHFLAATDNAYDIGASGATRPRTLYVATSVDFGSNGVLTGTSGGLRLTGGAGRFQLGGTSASFPSITNSGAVLQVKLADNSAYAQIDALGYSVGGAAGASGTFTTADAKTVTVTNGIITSIV
jgi:hypothetical protein